MDKTIYWRVIPDVIVISVHPDIPPSDEEWDSYLDEVVQHVNNVKGILVYSESVGPSAPQRARSNAAFKRANAKVQTAIMTGSRMVRGIVTALNWALGGKVKAFSTTDYAGAIDYLDLTNEEQLKARVVLKQLARSAGVTIGAFADESGTFRRKYGE